MSLNEWFQYVLSLFVIVSPLTAIPVLLGLTPTLDATARKKLGFRVGIACGLVLVATTWIGGPFLTFLQVKVASFQVTGGLVLLLLGLSMISKEPAKVDDAAKDASAIVVVPMAIPLLAGPGAISTVIVQSSLYTTFADKIYLSFAGIALGLIIATILYSASRIEKVLGQKGLNVATKLGGLILAALAVETMSKGVFGLIG